MPVFFPACKVLAQYPEESKSLWAYLQRKDGMRKAGCCRKDHAELAAEDQAVFICNNCHEIIAESSATDNLVSVWEIIDADPQFPFPNYEGREMALQDCWIAGDCPATHEAVRSLLQKMNVRVVELPENRAGSRFCGMNTLGPATESNKGLAPHRWVEVKDAQCADLPENERAAALRAHAESLPTKDVACYCKFCADGLAAGGAQPTHLIQLLFPNEK